MNAQRPTPRGVDRRRHGTRLFSRYFFVGRRRGFRRAADRVHGGYVDRPRTWDVAIVVLVIALSFADAIMTLDHIDRGGVEWNPVMARLLEYGVVHFVAGKMAVTTIGMVFLLVHMHFNRTRGFAIFVLLGYVALTMYHLTLLDIGALPDESTTKRLLATLGDVGRALFG